MLIPKKVKHRKWHKGRNRKSLKETRGTSVAYGSYGLKALESAWLTSRQIESARRTVSNYTKRGGKFWIRIFPDRPYTQKAAEVGMGKGKGDLQGYVFEVRPGRVLFEVDGVTEELAKEALRKAGTKLPMKVKFISRD